MTDKMLTIAKDFARFPGPRLREEGPNSGQQFRDDLLLPALRDLADGERLVVDLDGARGYTASFLEEAFGGLVRVCGMPKRDLNRFLVVQASDPSIKYWAKKIPEYIEDAQFDLAS
jgi:hypothetical protein